MLQDKDNGQISGSKLPQNGMKTMMRRLMNWPGRLALPLFLLSGAAAFQPYRPVVFLGESMAPTYPHLSMAMTGPVRRPLRKGDVVVIRRPEGTIIKRVAVAPGELLTVAKVRDRRVPMLNVRLREGQPVPRWIQVERVADDELYVMGDNAADSHDSRHFGAIKVRDVERVLLRPRAPVLTDEDKLRRRTW